MSFSVTFRGREIRSPALRVVVSALAIFGATIGLLIAIVVVPWIVAITLPIHFLLRLCGRRGFYVRKPDGSIEYSIIDAAAFKKIEAHT